VESIPATQALRTRTQPLADLVEQESARQHRWRHVAIGIALLTPFVGWGVWQLWIRPQPVSLDRRFRTEPATVGDVVREVRATGHLEAVTTVRVGAEISGRIADVLVDFNERVAKGQVLARFDRSTLLAQVRQADALLLAARAALAQARTDRERAVRELERLERLLRDGYVAQAERDAAADAARLSAQRVEAMQAQIDAQQAAAAMARTSLDHSIITSPIAGIVISRNIDPGQTVAAVLQTPELFVVAADLRQMRVIAGVDEADVGELATGQRARFTVNAYANRWFDGMVTDIRNSPAIVQDVVTYGTVVQVDNPDLALKPGMTAAVRIQTAEARGVTRIPAAALTFTPPGEQARSAAGVWVIERAVLRWIAVEPGVSDGELTAIAAGALPAGTRVVLDLTPEGRAAYGLGR
jgi:HlyD family secretion protein